MKACLYFFIIMIFPALAGADELYFKDGSVVKGRIVSVDSEYIRIIPDRKETPRERAGMWYSDNGGENIITIKREDIRRLVYSDGKDLNLSGAEEEHGEEAGIVSKEEEQGGNIRCALSAGIKKMSGNTTYQIGGKIETSEGKDELHFPLSELKFPLNVYFISLESDVELYDRICLNLNLDKNITDDAGKMKDSDWGVPFEYPYAGSGYYAWYGAKHKDIYSESDTEIEALIFDINVMYKIFNIRPGGSGVAVSFSAGLGYLYQRFDFVCVLLRQWDLRPDVPDDQNSDFEGDGRVGIKYNVRSHVPYLNIGIKVDIRQKIVFDASFGYSPYAMVRDRDNHVLRSKISKAECEGTAIMASGGISYFIARPVFIRAGLDYMSVDTEGWETQTDNGEYYGKIEQKNYSKRMSYGLALGGELRF